MATVLAVEITIEACVALANVCRDACLAVKQYPEESTRIRNRLMYLFSKVPEWSNHAHTNTPSHDYLVMNLYNSLETLASCLEALGESHVSKWRKRIRLVMEGKVLYDQMTQAESSLNTALQDLNNENTSFVRSQMNVLHTKFDYMYSNIKRISVMSRKVSNDSKYSDTSMRQNQDWQSTQDHLFLIEDQTQVTFDRMHRIGVGGFAKVFKGKYKNEDVAIKVIDIYRKYDEFEQMPNEIYQAECDRVRDEALLMKHCSVHPKIVDVFGYCLPAEKGLEPLLVVELMAWSLNRILHNEKQLNIPFCIRFKLMRDIASAIEFLHTQGIIHQDIKSSNILVDEKLTIAKLTDFGVAEKKGSQTTWSLRHNAVLETVLKDSGKKVAGTRAYQAPEIILETAGETACSAEMYSFGVTVWECLTRVIPHYEKEDRLRDLASDLHTLMLPFPVTSMINEPNLSAEEQNYVVRLESIAFLCLSKEPSQRPTASQVIEFFEENNPFSSELLASQLLSTRRDAIDKGPSLDPTSLAKVQDNSYNQSTVFEPVQALHSGCLYTTTYHPSSPPLSAMPCGNEDEINVFNSKEKISASNSKATFGLCTLLQQGLLQKWKLVLVIAIIITALSITAKTFLGQKHKQVSVLPDKSCFNTDDELSRSIAAFIKNDHFVREKYGDSIGDWCVDYIEDFSQIFNDIKDDGTIQYFDADISKWNTTAVTKMSQMFEGAHAFNQDLSSWNVQHVTDMSSMFAHANSFNQNISKWNVSSVVDMSFMFQGAEQFNNDLSSWDVSSVTDMKYMFHGSEKFNQNLAGWSISSVQDMTYMFYNANNFNKSLCKWGDQLKNDISCTSMFDGSSCPEQIDPSIDNIPTGSFCYSC